jgi:hypothetical protein
MSNSKPLFPGDKIKARTLVFGAYHWLNAVEPALNDVSGPFGQFWEAHCRDYSVIGYGRTKAEADLDLRRLLGLAPGKAIGWGVIANTSPNP